MTTLPLAYGRPTLADRLFTRSLATDIVLVVAGAGLTSILAQIAIPLWPVPVTGQTLAVLLVGSALGAVRGAVSLALYAVLGIVGLPVFSDGSSGFGVISGFTGGYIIGFIFSAALIGWIAQSEWDHKIWRAVLSALAGTVLTFVFGLVWLWAALGKAGYPNDLNTVLTGGLYPFILGGLVKAAIAGLIIGGSWWFIERNDRQRAARTNA
ncbi:MAG: biotin transport system substrate-specific component [Actinomycetota bacterium]|jgi:biotin transport system substrate-specific component|nr:biotin transport system substrate-specific component [Actinomycetota bacterium]